MKDETFTINTDLENQLTAIDDEKLPEIFNRQVQFLKEANQKYCIAEEKEMQARKKVNDVLKSADELIKAAKNVGNNAPKTWEFLGKEHTDKKDEIKTLKINLKEIIDHSKDSAEAQKKLTEVQSSLMESQTAILQIQKAQMEYQRQIANTVKFVFELSAYNMGVSQSIFSNLKAILSNETPEKMGELAQKHLFLALEQIRNQESLISRIGENEKIIDKLNSDIEKKQKEIDDINSKLEKTNAEIKTAGTEISNTLKESFKTEFNNLSKDFDKKISNTKAEIETKITENADSFKNEISTLKNSFEETNNKITELNDKINKLQYITSKIGWKIGISVVAVGSLILNILQIIGIL